MKVMSENSAGTFWIARIDAISCPREYSATWFLSSEDYESKSGKKMPISNVGVCCSSEDVLIMSTGPKYTINESKILDVVVVLRHISHASPIPITCTNWLYVVKLKYDPTKDPKHSSLTKFPKSQAAGLENLVATSKSVILWETAVLLRKNILSDLGSSQRQEFVGTRQPFSKLQWAILKERLFIEPKLGKSSRTRTDIVRADSPSHFGIKRQKTTSNFNTFELKVSSEKELENLTLFIGADWNFNITRKTTSRLSKQRVSIRSSSKNFNFITSEGSSSEISFLFRQPADLYSGEISTLRIGGRFQKICLSPNMNAYEYFSIPVIASAVVP